MSTPRVRVCRRGRRNAPSLLLGWAMGTFWSWMVWPNRSMSIQPPPSCKGNRVILTYRWITQHTPTRISLRAGVCCALPSCVQGLPGLGPRGGEGHFQWRMSGVVCPLAGGRCVPRTGVHLDCPLQVAWPAASPCLSLFPYSDANCPSSRAGALDRCQTVEGATAP